MSGNTEIYICKPGQAIKDGRIEVSNIQTRDEARIDAERRFKHDKSIDKIAYYEVRDDGTFKSIFSLESPTLTANRPAKAAVTRKPAARKRTRTNGSGAKQAPARPRRKNGSGIFGKFRSLFAE